jgi:hypothetical protein
MRLISEIMLKMLTSNSCVSSKRGAGLYLAFMFGIIVFIMALRGNYEMVPQMGYLAAALLGATLFENIFKKR